MREIHVVGAAIRDGNKILVAQRSEKMKAPLKWEFAGGKVEPGETHQQALQREVLEELGVKIRVGDHIEMGKAETGELRIVLHVYAAEILAGTPKAKEHAQLQWVEVERLPDLDWPEADRPVYRKILQLFTTNSL